MTRAFLLHQIIFRERDSNHNSRNDQSKNIPNAHSQQHYLIYARKCSVGDYAPLFHHPQTNHTDQSNKGAKGQIGRIPRPYLPGHIGENYWNSNQGAYKSDDANYGNNSRPFVFHDAHFVAFKGTWDGRWLDAPATTAVWSQSRLLGADHGVQHAPRLKLRCVGGDMDETVERTVDPVGLHRLQQVDVLHEGRLRAFV